MSWDITALEALGEANISWRTETAQRSAFLPFSTRFATLLPHIAVPLAALPFGVCWELQKLQTLHVGLPGWKW